MVSPQVRELYKAFIIAGRQHPEGWGAIRERVKKGFFDNKDLTDKKEIRKAIKSGWWMVEELYSIGNFHKVSVIKL